MAAHLPGLGSGQFRRHNLAILLTGRSTQKPGLLFTFLETGGTGGGVAAPRAGRNPSGEFRYILSPFIPCPAGNAGATGHLLSHSAPDNCYLGNTVQARFSS